MKHISKVIQNGKWKDASGPSGSETLCKPDCPTCGGVGYIRYDVPFGDPKFGRTFPCPNIPAESRLHEGHGLSAYEIQTLDYDALERRENITEGVRAVEKILQRGSGMLYICGGPGLAKTVLLKIACAKWARAGGVFRYTTQKDMLDEMRACYDDDEPQRAILEKQEKYVGYPLLALDEITAERSTEFKVEQFFHIINKRHEAGVEQGNRYATLLVGNISPNELDFRIADRLRDGRNQVIRLNGKSYRPENTWKEPERKNRIPYTGEEI